MPDQHFDRTLALGQTAHVRVFVGEEALAHAAAAHIANRAAEAVRQRKRFTWALAGGSTPRPVYRRLAEAHREDFPWEKTHLVWGDDRCVAPDDAASNYRLAREALIQHVPLAEAQVHRMPTELTDTAAAARQYEETLRALFPDEEKPVVDLMLLGLGADGHTASLFPEDAFLEAQDAAWVRAVMAPPRHTPRQRLTFTLPALNAAREVLFLVSGASKRPACRAILSAEAISFGLPAAHVAPAGPLHWFVDAAAFGKERRGEAETRAEK